MMQGNKTALRLLIAGIAAIILLVPLSGGASGKKGVGLSQKSDGAIVSRLNVDWYYNWSPYPHKSVEGNVEYVPMIWGGHKLDEHWKAVKSRAPVPVLLMINEPDHLNQAKMSVDEVAHIWPDLSKLAASISSPTPAQPLGPWIERFMSIAERRNLKVDFIAAHYYGPPNVDNFLKRIDATHEKYGLPIWITEFAVADHKASDSQKNRYTEEEVADFMRAILPELEKRPYVLRYAWFGTGRSGKEQVRTSRLVDGEGNLTRLGEIYAQWNRRPNLVAPSESFQIEFGEADRDKSGGVSLHEIDRSPLSKRKDLKKNFSAIDLNTDWQVTIPEYTRYLQKRADAWLDSFRRADEDRSGGLSRLELNKTGPSQFAYFKQHFEAIDADSDGQVTIAERDAYRSRAAMTPAPDWRAILKTADRDGSGGLSKEESHKMSPAHLPDLKRDFARIDANKNGEVTGEEYERYLADSEDDDFDLLELLGKLMK